MIEHQHSSLLFTDGKILTWSQDRTVKIWDALTGKELSSLKHANPVLSAAFNQDASRILSWDQTGQVYLWDDVTSQALLIWEKQASSAPGFSSDGRQIVLVGSDGEGPGAHVWDSATLQPLTPLLPHPAITGAMFSPHAEWLLTWSADRAQVWDLSTGQAASPAFTQPGGLNGAAFNSNGRRVVTWGQDGSARLWDSLTGQPLLPPLSHQTAVRGALFHPTQNNLLTWTADGRYHVWWLEVDEDFPQDSRLLQLETLTATHVNDLGELKFLSLADWQASKEQYMQLAREHLKTCQYPHANVLVNELIRMPESCQSPGAWLQEVNPATRATVASQYASYCVEQGQEAIRRNEYAQAFQAFETARNLVTSVNATHAKQLAEVYTYLARSLIISRRDVQQGIEYARQALAIDPGQSPDMALHILADGLDQTGTPIERAQTYLRLASVYAHWRNYAAALNAYQQALDDPDLTQTLMAEYAQDHALLTIVSLYQLEYDQAFQEYAQVIQDQMNNLEKADFLNMLGKALQTQANLEVQANVYFEKAKELSENLIKIIIEIPIFRPMVFALYYQYYRADTYAQWWFPGKDPNQVLGPEPWRRDLWLGPKDEYPYIGMYDNVQNKEILRWHIRLAKAAGIEAFLVSINDWQKEQEYTWLLLDVAAEENFKIGFIEYHSYLGAVGSGVGGESGDILHLNEDILYPLVERLTEMLTQAQSHPAYLRIDGKPLIVIPYMDMNVTPDVFTTVISKLETRLEEQLYVVAIVPQIYWYFYPDAVLNTGITPEWAESDVDCFTHWTPNGMINASQKTRLQVNQFVVDDSRKWQKDAMIPLMPGFDDDNWRPGDDPAPTLPRNNGIPWSEQLDAALAAHPRFLLVQAWNEWHEGSQIEPSTGYSDPYLYLQILAQKLGIPWQTPPLPPKDSIDPLRLPYLPY